MYESVPREDLVETAVSFLSNPDVRKTSFSQQEAFLKKKGLTSEQIRRAYERSLSNVINVPVQNVDTIKPVNFGLKISWFHRLKDLFNTLAILVGGSYGFYCLYKRFIEPFLFGKPKKPKTIDSSISNLSKTVEKSVNELKVDVHMIQNELKKIVLMQSDQHSNVRQFAELKSEVAIIKSILLSRHEYSQVGIPSIPSWQLRPSSRKPDKDDKEIIENEEGENHSGSSETEIGPNPNSNGGSQGSDSSLEMIKEVDP